MKKREVVTSDMMVKNVCSSIFTLIWFCHVCVEIKEKTEERKIGINRQKPWKNVFI